MPWETAFWRKFAQPMTSDLTDPTAVALPAARALEANRLPYALYGGLMLAAYGEPRETRDAELAVARVSPAQAREAFASAGLMTSVSFSETAFGGLRIRLKALSTRERDLDDAASVLVRTSSGLDLEMVDRELVLFAADLPDGDIRGRFAEIRRRASSGSSPSIAPTPLSP